MGVRVTVPDIPSALGQFDAITVGVGFGMRSLEVGGGQLEFVGSAREILEQITFWRSKRPAEVSSVEDESVRRPTKLLGLTVMWRDREVAPTQSIEAGDVEVVREARSVVCSARSVAVQLGLSRVDVRGVELEALRGASTFQVHKVAARAIDGELRWPLVGSVDSVEHFAVSAQSDVPRATATLLLLRDRLREGVGRLDRLFAPGAAVEVQALRVKVAYGSDSVGLGPGKLTVRRADGRFLVSLVPGAGEAEASSEKSLTFTLSVPIADSDPGDVLVDMSGGPIGFETLGVKDGDFGLLDVARTSLELRSRLALSGDGKTLRVDGEGRVHGLSLRSAALSDEAVRGLEMAWRGKVEALLDGSRVSMDDGELDLGDIHMRGHGVVERTSKDIRVHGDFDTPMTPCQAMFDSVPKGLVPKLDGMRLAGSFAMKTKIALDTANIEHDYLLDADLANSCRVTEVPRDLDVARFHSPFKHTVYSPSGEPSVVELGPGTPNWVGFGAISRFMEVALLTTEDGGFHRHHGFEFEAIRNSIRENIRKGKFVRGASTLSMQLAKNLYLERTKTLSRKLQEAVLTMYLEQALTKEQILELYLNIVEFGPNIYGIGPAARAYFNASPSSLSLGQALYVTSLLPNPKQQHFEASGVVSAGHMRYLHKLMEIAHRRHHVTDAELEEGLAEIVVRGQPSLRGEPPDDPRDDSPVDGAAEWQAP